MIYLKMGKKRGGGGGGSSAKGKFYPNNPSIHFSNALILLFSFVDQMNTYWRHVYYMYLDIDF